MPMCTLLTQEKQHLTHSSLTPFYWGLYHHELAFICLGGRVYTGANTLQSPTLLYPEVTLSRAYAHSPIDGHSHINKSCTKVQRKSLLQRAQNIYFIFIFPLPPAMSKLLTTFNIFILPIALWDREKLIQPHYRWEIKAQRGYKTWEITQEFWSRVGYWTQDAQVP